MDIVVDIGGTNMRAASVVDGSLGEVRKVPTPTDPSEGVQALARLARECAGTEAVSALAGGIAADRIDATGRLSGAHNLRAWEGPDVVGTLSRLLNAPVVFVNDAAAAGLGEAAYGAGRGASSVAYITVSTGVGGGLIRDGSIAAAGSVSEIEVDGAPLESLVSGTAVRKKFGIHPKDLASLEEREKLADILARGLNIIAERWSPEVIVLGGSMITGVNPIPFERVRSTFDSLFDSALNKPTLKMAELGDNGGLWGGVAFLKRGS